MPGPYAHITLLYELMHPRRLERFFSAESQVAAALESYFPYCVLGAVSPDYPNLARGDGSAAHWADAMHCSRVGEMMARGLARVRGASGTARGKQLAWLLGYCAHVATDVTIHPVVQAKVGVYADNQRQHRLCEMHQDSHIYRRMNLGEIGESEVFARIVARCGDPADAPHLDRDIVTLWQGMLADVHPRMCSENPPDCDAWHREFTTAVADSAPGAPRLFPLAATIAAKTGLAYPPHDVVDLQFIEAQTVPLEPPRALHYDEIFDRAADNVCDVWCRIERSLTAEDPTYEGLFGDWNLDNGRDGAGRLVFWE